MNKCIFSGRLVKEPIMKKFENGTLAQFSLAVKEKYKDRKTGKYAVTFVDVKVWGVMAENLEKYAAKGMEVLITSHYTVEEYESNSEKKKYKCFVADEIEYLSGGKKKEEPRQATDGAEQETAAPATKEPNQEKESSIDEELKDMGFGDLPGFDVNNPFPG